MKILKFLIILWSAGQVTGQSLQSGLPIGTDGPAFDPYHVSGPDKGTRTCPMCKYGSQQGVMIWVNSPDWNALAPIVQRMESEAENRGLRKFRVFVIYMNPEHKALGEVMKESRTFAERLDLQKVAITCIPDPTDAESARLFEINPDKKVRNTVLVYKKRKMVSKTINLEASGLDELIASCDKLFGKDSF